MVIKVDYIRVNSFLSEMMRLTEEVMREFERMDEVVEDFSIFWDSEASGEYGMRIYTDLYNAKAVIQKIQHNIRMIGAVLRKFDDAEKKIGNLVDGI